MNKEQRDKIIKLLDSEQAWDHVLINYFSGARYLFQFRMKGKPDLRNNATRIAVKINDILGADYVFPEGG